MTNEVGCQHCEDKMPEFQSDTCSISNEHDAASVPDNDLGKEEIEKDLFSRSLCQYTRWTSEVGLDYYQVEVI